MAVISKFVSNNEIPHHHLESNKLSLTFQKFPDQNYMFFGFSLIICSVLKYYSIKRQRIPKAKSTVAMFVGQGEQKIGMLKPTSEVTLSDFDSSSNNSTRLVDLASKVINLDLEDICNKGPKSKIDKTDIAQPALFTASIGAISKQPQELRDSISVSLGLSLGEYSALCEAGCFSFTQGISLVRERGLAMQEAAEQVSTGMAAVQGLTLSEVKDFVVAIRRKLGVDEEGEVNNTMPKNPQVWVANILMNGNYVISGHTLALEVANELASDFKVKKLIRLPVAGAFHTPYMLPAAERLDKVLSKINILPPKYPVISNYDNIIHNGSNTKKLLLSQLISPVQWESSMNTIIQNNTDILMEVGTGKTLSNIAKKMGFKNELRKLD